MAESILKAYPGQSKIIQIFNPDGTTFVIPGGAVLSAKVTNVWQRIICDLLPTTTDASKGLIRLALPDTLVVRQYANRPVFYDLLVEAGGLKKYILIGQVEIQYSPTLYSSVLATVPSSPSPSPSSSPSPSPSPSPSTQVVRVYVQDQVWVNQNGDRVLVEIEEQLDGRQLFKLTEILS